MVECLPCIAQDPGLDLQHHRRCVCEGVESRSSISMCASKTSLQVGGWDKNHVAQGKRAC
jgi:hypothetical protein